MHYFLCLYVLAGARPPDLWPPSPRAETSSACPAIVTITEFHDVNSCIPGRSILQCPPAFVIHVTTNPPPLCSSTSTHRVYDNDNKNNANKDNISGTMGLENSRRRLVKIKCTYRAFSMGIMWRKDQQKIEVHMPFGSP